MPSTLPVHQTEIDGVPVFWSDVRMPRMAALMFGVGRAHERAATGGITHLVEHLALAPLTQQAYGHNGFVALNRTVFHASGTDEELSAYFGAVGRGLTSLPMDRVGTERRILRREAAGRGPAVAAWLMWCRFGAVGYGLLGTDELGLGWLGPSLIDDWANRMFTRENAAVWLSGPPPRDLRLPLRSGRRPPEIPPTTTPQFRPPSHLAWNSTRVAISYLAERSAAAMAAIELIARRAREVLRFEKGLVYDVQTDYERLGRLAHCVVDAECHTDDAATVRDELIAALDGLAGGGATDAEVQHVVRGFRDALDVPQSQLGFLDGACFDRLSGLPFDAPESIVASYEALDAAQIGSILTEARATLLLCAPGSNPDERRWTAYPDWSSTSVAGRTFHPPGWNLLRRKPDQTLTVGPDGVTWRSPEGNPLTVRYADCVAYRHWEGDLRQMWGADGTRVVIDPREWKHGVEAVRLVDAAVDPTVVSCDEHGVGAYEDPADHQA